MLLAFAQHLPNKNGCVSAPCPWHLGLEMIKVELQVFSGVFLGINKSQWKSGAYSLYPLRKLTWKEMQTIPQFPLHLHILLHPTKSVKSLDMLPCSFLAANSFASRIFSHISVISFHLDIVRSSGTPKARNLAFTSSRSVSMWIHVYPTI